MARKRACDFATLATGFAFTAVFFIAVVMKDGRPGNELANVWRFALLPSLLFTVFLAFGLEAVLQAGRRLISLAGPLASHPRAAIAPLMAFLLLVCMVPFISSAGSASLRGNRLAENYSADLFACTSRGAVLLVEGEIENELAIYSQQVKGARKDVAVVSRALSQYPWYRKQLKKRYPGLIVPDMPAGLSLRVEKGGPTRTRALQSYLNILVEKNIGSHEINSGYLEPFDRQYELLPLGIILWLLPKGTLLNSAEYARTSARIWRSFNLKGLKRGNSRSQTSPRTNIRDDQIRENYAAFSGFTAITLSEAEDFEAALDYYRLTLEIQPEAGDYQLRYAELLERTGRSREAAALLYRYAARAGEAGAPQLKRAEELQESLLGSGGEGK